MPPPRNLPQPPVKAGKNVVSLALTMSNEARACIPESHRAAEGVKAALNDFVRHAQRMAETLPELSSAGEKEVAERLMPLATAMAGRIAVAVREAESGSEDDASWVVGAGGLNAGAGAGAGEADGATLESKIVEAMHAKVGLTVEEFDEDTMEPEDYLKFLEKNANKDMSSVREVMGSLPPEIRGKIAEMQRTLVKDLKGMASSGKSFAALGAEVMRRMETAPQAFMQSMTDEERRRMAENVKFDDEQRRKILEGYRALQSMEGVVPGMSNAEILMKARMHAST